MILFASIRSFRSLMLALACASVFFASCSEDKKDDNNNNNNNNATKYETVGNTVRVRDLGNGTGTITWTADKTYVLENFVFVNEGQTLTIQPGTVIKGVPGQNTSASALIVARGAKIIAEGTAEKPIIFTTFEDDVAKTDEPVDNQTGRWGGLILLGRARTNTAASERAIEGIPTSERRGLYGGTNDDDNSGILKYVSVRHGGTLIGAENEINGITFGSVGRGTQVSHIEVAFNDDDGVEFFGGTVDAKYISLAFNGDDNIDYDEGYRGRLQHVLILQNDKTGIGERGLECDGGSIPVDGKPYATPRISNITAIGGSTGEARRQVGLWRENAGGFIHNSIFTNFGTGAVIEDLAADKGEDSWNRVSSSELAFRHNLFGNIGASTKDSLCILRNDAAANKRVSAFTEVFVPGNNRVGDPGLTISYANNATFSPVPTGNVGNPDNISDTWFDKTDYVGAFAPGNNNHWLRGWTFLDTHNYLKK